MSRTQVLRVDRPLEAGYLWLLPAMEPGPMAISTELASTLPQLQARCRFLCALRGASLCSSGIL